MNDPVPTVLSIDEIYTSESLPRQKIRYAKFVEQFQALYQQKPHFISRSPGRVNIIGEHIDYSLYDVLPMAITSDVLVAVAVDNASEPEPVVSLANSNSAKFTASEFRVPLHGNIEIDSSTLQWTNYFKAGFRGAVELCLEKEPNFRARGMRILIDGTVPAGGGLSSSAAFVCASALAVLRANGHEKVIKRELVERAIVSERSVGVNSGGMDQAASVFSVRGDAVSVAFSPQLNVTAIKFPVVDPPMTFMIAQSFIVADKHVTAPRNYNLRVVECTLAAEVLASLNKIKLQTDSGPLGRSLRAFQLAYFASKGTSLDEEHQLEALVNMTRTQLTQIDGYTRQEISELMKMSIAELEKRYMSRFPVETERFLLRQRTEHVFMEALRVQKFKNLLKDTKSGSNNELLSQLGSLMNETQASCRDLYDCSCPELDELCHIARSAGSYGSRLTGAGWGGCTVHLVPKDKVADIEDAWLKQYYQKQDPSATRADLVAKDAIIVSDPGHGAMILNMT